MPRPHAPRDGMDPDQRRIESERAFHNERFGSEEDLRRSLDKWYAAVFDAHAEQDAMVRRLASGAVALEYGCADGAYSLGPLGLQRIARELHGIDISDQAIAVAERRARALGASNTSFQAMNAEAMTYAPGTFDLVFGRGIIHHLDLDRAFGELRRVLKPGGAAVFLEPLGHNPVINWYRARTPSMRTPDEHPLLRADYALASRYFSRVEVRFFGLCTLAAVPLGSGVVARGAQRAFAACDRALLTLPGLKWQAWVALSVMTR